MRHVLLAAALAAATAGPVWAQDSDLWERWLRSTPEKRAAARELLAERYPALATELQAHLAARYPGFEIKAARGLVAFHEAHPGLLAGVGKHLLEDLGGEPADALLDVVEAVTARYPRLPQRLLELRRTEGPGMRLRELVATRYPLFRSEVLQLLSERRAAAPWREALAAVRQRHPGLRWAVLLEVSRLADERFPGLTREFLASRREGTRPLRWLWENHPEFVQAAARRVYTAQGEKLRLAAIDLLGELEKRPRPSELVAGRLLELVEKRHPELPAQALTARLEAQRALRTTLRQEFPELLPLVAHTLQKEHPQLLTRAADSVHQHYPTLRAEVWQALEAELPGLRQEVKGYLRQTHPDLEVQIERIL